MTAPTSAGRGPSLRVLCGVVTRSMVRRSLLTALLVGGVLFGVNSGDTLARTGFTNALIVKLAITMLIPFVVSLSSSAATHLEIRAVGSRGAGCSNAIAEPSATGLLPDVAARDHRSKE